MLRGITMHENDFFCPECGTKLKQGEINRIKSGIDIACHVCGIEIIAPEPSDIIKKTTTTEYEPNDLGDKIKRGIQSFVQGIKSFAESFDGDKKKDDENSNEYSDK
jgi:hypothetical protein